MTDGPEPQEPVEPDPLEALDFPMPDLTELAADEQDVGQIMVHAGGHGLFSMRGGFWDGRNGLMLDHDDAFVLKIDGGGRSWCLGSSKYASDNNAEQIAEALERIASNIRSGVTNIFPVRPNNPEGK